MTEQRKTAAPPIIAGIPAELMERTQWVCWSFAWRSDTQGGGKWTKVPYTPHTTKKARSNAASSWRSFQAALSCYQERPDFFDGIGYMFAKDDPYVGGDIDHCIIDGVLSDVALALLPATYAEISPSGDGVKFIGRASGDYGRKTARGELYSKTRFFTITGNVLPGHATITECQEAIDAFAVSLGATVRATRAGGAGSGSRAERAAAISDELWQAGRQERRTNINRLLARLRASAVSRKTGKDDTQLGYLLREDYRGFHEKYPYATIVRADGSIDSSQIRAVMASNIKIRGFIFPEFVALMSYFFGAECAAKWGTKQGVQAEFATLWFIGRSPRADEATPPTPAPVKRGRGSDHGALRDHAYAVIQSYRVGVDAILTIHDLASDMHISRRAAATLLAELAANGRISKRKNGQYGGLIVSFPDMHNEEKTIDAIPHNNGVIPHVPVPTMSAGGATGGMHSDMHNTQIIYSDREQPNAVNGDTDDIPMSADQDNEPTIPDMHNETGADPQFTAPGNSKALLCIPDDERGSEAALYSIYNQYCVSSADICIPQKRIRNRVSLADAVSAAFDELPHDRTLETGEIKRWPITAARVLEYIADAYADQGWKAEAVRYWIGKIRKRRKAQTFDELRGMRRDTLEKKAASARKQIARAEEKAVTAEMPELREWYTKRAGQLAGQQAMYAWELGQRDARDEARIESEGYSLGEQAEMLALIEQATLQKPMMLHRQPAGQADIGGLVARLKARKVND
jgi:hypothetical protein